MFFYKEQKRTERTECSFEKNGCPTLPFGLKTSPPGFCCFIHMVLSGLLFAGFYMDDILVGGQGVVDMTKNLIAVFECLAKYNLKIQLSKINFYKSEIKIFQKMERKSIWKEYLQYPPSHP